MVYRRRSGRHTAPNARRFSSVRRFTVWLAAGVVVGVSGFAIAAWLISGSGEGAAVAGEAQTLVLTQGTPQDALLPGGTASVAVDVQNPNPFPVSVSEISQDGDITSDTSGCDPSNHGVSFTTQTGPWDIAANSTESLMLFDSVAMSLDSGAACQGAAFVIPLMANGLAGLSPPTEPPAAPVITSVETTSGAISAQLADIDSQIRALTGNLFGLSATTLSGTDIVIRFTGEPGSFPTTYASGDCAAGTTLGAVLASQIADDLVGVPAGPVTSLVDDFIADLSEDRLAVGGNREGGAAAYAFGDVDEFGVTLTNIIGESACAGPVNAS